VTRQAGLGKFEFAVVLAIFGVLATLLLGRLVALEQATEQLEVELTVRHINTGIKLAVADAIMRGEEARTTGLIDENPLNFLDLKVGAGGTAQPDAATMGTAQPDAANPGTAPALTGWRYDKASRTLNYRTRQPEAFGGHNLLRWRYTSHTDELGRTVGLRLEALK
jgi:type II secretory pathway pseudopilin PulG